MMMVTMATTTTDRLTDGMTPPSFLLFYFCAYHLNQSPHHEMTGGWMTTRHPADRS